MCVSCVCRKNSVSVLCVFVFLSPNFCKSVVCVYLLPCFAAKSLLPNFCECVVCACRGFTAKILCVYHVCLSCVCRKNSVSVLCVCLSSLCVCAFAVFLQLKFCECVVCLLVVAMCVCVCVFAVFPVHCSRFDNDNITR